ncbi:hypothetical protein RHMOL_Rhmol09G0189800 [Rhododendron molle]|uniref:Uncharacterized protein n=1 Tax=Rhododendron molle TaxID=49168 RepID=A0ACC0MGQ1_RHOML|nr:hypothetical protein RHMOL_Rhmol09G0189800 [Rhododendron molle]
MVEKKNSRALPQIPRQNSGQGKIYIQTVKNQQKHQIHKNMTQIQIHQMRSKPQ